MGNTIGGGVQVKFTVFRLDSADKVYDPVKGFYEHGTECAVTILVGNVWSS